MCKECHSEYRKKHYRANKARVLQVVRALELKKKYGITLGQYQELFELGNGLCWCCGRKWDKTLVVDHDHNDGGIRGLLCGPCNIGIGLLNDRIEGIENALSYLKNYQYRCRLKSISTSPDGPLSGFQLMSEASLN